MTGWRRVRLDSVVTREQHTVLPEVIDASEVFHYSIPVLEETGDGRVEPVEEVGSAKLLLRSGEVLISKLNPRKSRVLLSEPHECPTIASLEFIALRPTATIDRRFLRYLLLSEDRRQHLDAHMQSVTRSQQRFDPDVLTKSWIDLPLLHEQEEIARFLDSETARIDALIGKRQRMVRLLQERRAVVMHDGVAGLLTSTRKRCLSGLPWLSTRPTSWAEVKLTLVAKLGSGHTPSRDHPEWWENCTIPWVTTGEVAQVRDDRVEHLSSTREKISELGVRNSAAEVHPAGTVVLSRTASAGYSAIMGTDMATSQDYATWTCGPRLRPRFLLLCLRVMRNDLLGRLAMGSTHKTIYMPDVESIHIPLPPLEEQDAIVEGVYGRLGPIDALTDKLNLQISLLQERRQALITAAVSGQLDVTAAVV